MTILNNVVNKISNAGSNNKMTKVDKEIKKIENLTVSSDMSAKELEEFEKSLINKIEDGKIDSANSNLHKWSASSKYFNLKLNSDTK